MVQVTTTPQVSMNNVMSPIQQVILFFKNYWWLILILIITIITIFLVFLLMKIIKKERLERDSEAYANYNNTIADCKQNADKKLIRCKWSPLNLLWLGIPFKVNEHSAKLLDVDRNLIGYYRGHYYSQDGTLNYLIYKHKSLGLFENEFILKVPLKLKIPLGPIKKHTKSNKQDLTKYKEINFSNLITNDKYNDDIHFKALGCQKISTYYKTPNFIYDDGGVIDLRQSMMNTINDETWKLGFERMVNMHAKSMRKATEGNPYVQARKQGGEIEQENKEIETEENYT